MKFDKTRLMELAALPDEKLWEEIMRIAGTFGYSLPNQTPPHEELEKMRSMVRSDKINVTEAMRMVNRYKKAR